jgi:putative ABC transport system substrate-binding protein
MRRREFIAIVGGAVVWPFAARAQQLTMPAIGFLDSRSPEAVVSRLRAFRQGLQETNYVEGENVAIVYRFAENQLERLSDLARDLVQRRVAVIVTPGEPSAFAAKAVTANLAMPGPSKSVSYGKARSIQLKKLLQRHSARGGSTCT